MQGMDSQLFSMMSRVINSTINYFTLFFFLIFNLTFSHSIEIDNKKCGITGIIFMVVYLNTSEMPNT
jgi:hypothetical protein